MGGSELSFYQPDVRLSRQVCLIPPNKTRPGDFGASSLSRTSVRNGDGVPTCRRRRSSGGESIDDDGSVRTHVENTVSTRNEENLAAAVQNIDSDARRFYILRTQKPAPTRSSADANGPRLVAQRGKVQPKRPIVTTEPCRWPQGFRRQ